MTLSKTDNFHRPRFDNLDFIRGIAALAVAIAHFAPYAGFSLPQGLAKICVAYFFILSSFVLCHAYLDRIRQGEFTLGEFVSARLARLYPLHILTFIVVAVYWGLVTVAARHGVTVNETYDWRLDEIISTVTLTQLMHLDDVGFNSPSWSISVEFWCGLYIFFLCAPIGRFVKILSVLIACVGYGLILETGGFVNPKLHYPYGFLETNYVSGFFLFALGWGVYHSYKFLKARNYSVNSISGWVLAAAVSSVIWLQPVSLAKMPWDEPALFLAIAATILALALGPGQREFMSRFMHWTGSISFGIYLWHIPLMLGLIAAAKIFALLFGFEIPKWCLMVSFCALICPLAHISYRFFELPMKNRLRETFTGRGRFSA